MLKEWAKDFASGLGILGAGFFFFVFFIALFIVMVGIVAFPLALIIWSLFYIITGTLGMHLISFWVIYAITYIWIILSNL